MKQYIWVVYGHDGCEGGTPDGVFVTARDGMRAVNSKRGKNIVWKKWGPGLWVQWQYGREDYWHVERFKIGELGP